MGEFKEFLKSKIFYKNLGIAVVLLIAVFWGASKMLDIYTRHGQFITLPDFTKKPLADVQKMLADKGLMYKIIDSTYDEKLPPRTVINQNPYPGAPVKEGRNIYLYITNAVAPMVVMPNMTDMPLENAKLTLKNNGIKIGGISYERNICAGCVLKVIYKGKVVEDGDKLPKGSVVELVVGKGDHDDAPDSP